jgi:hypothetical protein
MDKFALWPKGIARLLIAGLLACALVFQGMATAVASSHSGALDVSSGNLDHCAGDADNPRHSPGPQPPCSCCIACRAFQIDGAAGHLSLLLEDFEFSPPHDIVCFGLFPGADTTPPLGWISSWSQRAPPGLS